MSGGYPFHQFAARSTFTRNVMFANNLFQQTLPALLSIRHILSDPRITAPLVSMMGLLGAVAVSVWRVIITCSRPEGYACRRKKLSALLLTESILAHEMMHAWLRIKGYRTLSQDVEEGICQVLAGMWLEFQILSLCGSNAASTSSSSLTEGSTSPLEGKLGVFFKQQMESDTSLVYGDGYRAGKQAILRYGLTRLTGYFPC